MAELNDKNSVIAELTVKVNEQDTIIDQMKAELQEAIDRSSSNRERMG